MPLPETVSTEELASLVGLSGRRIRQLADEGVIRKLDRNQFPLADSLQSFWRHREEEIRAEFEESDCAAASYEKERARLTKAKADKAEIEAALLKGTIHDGAAVAAVVGDMIANFRTKVLSIPNSCAAVVADLSDAESCRSVLDERCREACQELSEYDPGRVIEIAREELKGREPEGEDEE